MTEKEYQIDSLKNAKKWLKSNENNIIKDIIE